MQSSCQNPYWTASTLFCLQSFCANHHAVTEAGEGFSLNAFGPWQQYWPRGDATLLSSSCHINLLEQRDAWFRIFNTDVNERLRIGFIQVGSAELFHLDLLVCVYRLACQAVEGGSCRGCLAGSTPITITGGRWHATQMLPRTKQIVYVKLPRFITRRRLFHKCMHIAFLCLFSLASSA